MSTPWPRPLPKWFWPWVLWRLGHGEFKGDPRNPARRPAGIPKVIPMWAFQYLKFRRQQQTQPPLPPPPDEHPGLAFWRGMGVWITRIDHFNPDTLTQARSMGYRYVILPTLFGTEYESYPDGTKLTPEKLRAWIARARQAGVKVVGSQWGRAQTPEGARIEALDGAAACQQLGFDGWVINGEKNYEFNGTSGAYCREFRRLLPTLPLGFSPEPRLALDHGELQRLGVCYMPQAYPLENRYDVEACADVGVGFGYLPKNMVPLIQAYKSPVGEVYPAARYREQARARSLPGLILYPGNQNGDWAYWRELVV